MARPAIKKRLIENAAISLIATHGLPGTTIKDIAVTAGVTEGALYRHYAGKHEMAWSLYCREVEAFTTAFEPVLTEAGRPLQDRLRRGVEFIYQYYEDHPHELVFVMMTRQGFPEQSLLDANVDPDAVLIRFLEAEMASGTVRAGDPTLLMAMARGLVLEPIFMHRYGKLTTRPLDVVDDVVAACARLLGG